MADFYFYNNGSGDTDWNNPDNWWLDSAYSNPVGSVPTPYSGQLVEIDSNLDTNIPYWTFDVYISNVYVTLTSDVGSFGTVTLGANSVLTIQSGELILYGNLSNGGTIDLIGGNINIQAGSISNTYSINISVGTTLLNYGGILNNSAGYLINYGTLNNAGIFAQGNFFNYGTYINNYYYYNTLGETDWNAGNSWWFDPSYSFPVDEVPTFIPNQDVANIYSNIDTNIPQTLNIPVNLYANFTIANSLCYISSVINLYNYSVFIINNYVNNTGTISLYNYSLLQNFSLIENNNSLIVNNNATFTNNGKLQNNQLIQILDNGTLTSTSGYFNNLGVFSISNRGALIYIDQTKYLGNLFCNGGFSASYIFYDNTLLQEIASLDYVSYNPGIFLNIVAPITLTGFACPIINYSALTITGYTGYQLFYPLINNGTLTTTNTVNLTQPFTNNGSVINNGSLTIASTFTTVPSATLINNGTFTYGSYTTKFKGPIYPQVPSSASWGNIFI